MAHSESSTETNRLFTEDELSRMATPTSILLENAAASIDKARIEEIVGRMNAEHLAIYDAYIQWLGVLQTHLIETEGEARHREALKQAATKVLPEFVLDYEDVTFRERVEMLASRFRAGGSTFETVESDDRVTFQLDPWGPTRLWRQPQAWLDDQA